MPETAAELPQILGLLMVRTAERRGAIPVKLMGAGSLPLRSGGSLQKKGLTDGIGLSVQSAQHTHSCHNTPCC